MATERAESANHSLTLERGLRVLRVLADHPDGLTVSGLALALDTHRPGIYRLLGPLSAERLVAKQNDGRYSLGIGLVELARNVRQRLQEIAVPVLRQLADELEATTALTLRDEDEAVVAAVIEPRRAQSHLAYRPGLRHPLDVAAPGLAILAANPPLAGEREEIRRARRRGWARSSGELLFGATGVATAIVVDGAEPSASISAVWLQPRDEKTAAVRVVAAAQQIAAGLA